MIKEEWADVIWRLVVAARPHAKYLHGMRPLMEYLNYKDRTSGNRHRTECGMVAPAGFETTVRCAIIARWTHNAEDTETPRPHGRLDDIPPFWDEGTILFTDAGKLVLWLARYRRLKGRNGKRDSTIFDATNLTFVYLETPEEVAEAIANELSTIKYDFLQRFQSSLDEGIARREKHLQSMRQLSDMTRFVRSRIDLMER